MDTGESGKDRPVPAAPQKPAWRRWLPLIAILAITASGYALGWHEYLSLSTLIRERDALAEAVASHLVVAALAYLALYVVAVALSFPGASLITIIGGFLFGWALGGTLTAVGATAGAGLIFLAARTSLGATLKARAGPFLNRLAAGFREDAFHYLLFLRLAPVFPFWLVNIAPAVFDMRLRPYLVATFFGILPGTFAYAFIGAGLDSVIAAQEAADPGCAAAGTCSIELSALITRDIVLAFAALGLAALIPVGVKKWRRRKAPPA
ncbi:TVP38/TMEM64 family protein [Stappia stellulata]|uniref:TVP38/TMEM64 family protein n=1 Tax=Stappia stellulata TaxID=71235 RepID=UPI0003F81A80|nr:TVP38/TMEM64 family protein [Stappia stellulata]